MNRARKFAIIFFTWLACSSCVMHALLGDEIYHFYYLVDLNCGVVRELSGNERREQFIEFEARLNAFMQTLGLSATAVPKWGRPYDYFWHRFFGAQPYSTTVQALYDSVNQAKIYSFPENILGETGPYDLFYERSEDVGYILVGLVCRVAAKGQCQERVEPIRNNLEENVSNLNASSCIQHRMASSKPGLFSR